MPSSHSCKIGKHSWCLEAAYDKVASITTTCSCECHKEEQIDDGEIQVMRSHQKTLSLKTLLLITIFMVGTFLIGYQVLYELVSDVFTTPPVVENIQEWESFEKDSNP